MKLVIEHAVWTQVLDRDPDLIDEAGLLVLDGDVVINFRHDPAIIKDDQGNPTHVVYSHAGITQDTIEAVSWLVEQVLADDPVERSETAEGRREARLRACRAARLAEIAQADDDKTYRQQLVRARNKLSAVREKDRPADVVRFWRDEVDRLEPLAQAERDAIRQVRQAARQARGELARTLFFAARSDARAAERQEYNRTRPDGAPAFGDLTDEQKEAIYTWPDWADMDNEAREPWFVEASRSVGHPGVTGE